jgi:hypothetical protein
MTWKGRVACTRIRIMHVGFWWESQKKRHYQKNINVDGKITLI